MTATSMSRLLQRRYYLGYTRYYGTERRGTCPRLVDGRLFEAVQAVIVKRQAGDQRWRRRHHYLKGLLHCGHCLHAGKSESRLSYTETTGRRGGRFRYFFCRTRSVERCRQFIPAHMAESHLLSIWADLRRIPTARCWSEPSTPSARMQDQSLVRHYKQTTDTIRHVMNQAIFERVHIVAPTKAHHA